LLNTLLEAERFGGPANNTRAAAQDLTPGVIGLGAGGSRAAVAGSVAGSVTLLSENFETGALPPGVTTFSSTPQGRIRVAAPGGSATPSASPVLMARTPAGVYNLNEVVWTVDLTGLARATLSFLYLNRGGGLPLMFSGRVNGGGVAVSDDGVRWRTLPTPPSPARLEWLSFSTDLVATAPAARESPRRELQMQVPHD